MTRLAALTTFGPEIMATLVEGSRKEVVVELSYKEAVVLRQRMHQLRARMRYDKHELTNIVSAAKVTIRWGEEVATSTSRRGVKYPTDSHSKVELVVRPQDSTFRKALEKAGIKIAPEPVEPLLSSDIPGAETPDHVIEEFLKERSQK